MSDDSQEFVTEPVLEAHRVGWIRVGLISAMVGFSLPTFVAGVEVFQVTPNDRDEPTGHPSSQGLYPSQPLFRPRLSAPPG